ncbi:hypothetical protein M0R19_03025 [Candidatus Pacearchaeota archaeon]|jgi:hypothetical protein|nr:hypothetical protein [Candidatus Pacearchaeota archaeon]
MIKNISKAVAYNMKSGEVCVGICDEIRDISKNNREIKLKEAFIIPSENQYKDDKEFIKDIYEILDKNESFPIKIKDIKNSYILH